MKKIIVTTLSLFLLLISCKTTNAPSSTQLNSAITKAKQLAQSTLEENNFPGLAVAVAIKGKLVWSEGFGYSNISSKEVITPQNSRFRVGSISKSYTAAALAKLYEADKIQLDGRVTDYVPSFPKKKYPISIRNLAGHLGGIRHYRGSEFLSNRHYPTVKEGLDVFKDDPLIFEPGSKYAYSSYGWNLLSVVIENSANRPFLNYMTASVFKPLKMSHTVPEFVDKKITGKVNFYQLEENRIVEAPVVDNSYKWAGGGFLSSAEDVIRFANAHAKPGYLKASTLKTWTTSQKTTSGDLTNYGIGWRMGKDPFNRNWYGHSGGSVGGTSMMAIYPEEQLTVVTLVNLSNAKMNDLAFKIANEFIQSSQGR